MLFETVNNNVQIIVSLPMNKVRISPVSTLQFRRCCDLPASCEKWRYSCQIFCWAGFD